MYDRHETRGPSTDDNYRLLLHSKEQESEVGRKKKQKSLSHCQEHTGGILTSLERPKIFHSGSVFWYFF